jgi:hypothetical protein
LISLTSAAAATIWAKADASIRDLHIVPIVYVIFFFSWPIASLVYMWVTRRWQGVGLWIINATSLMMTLSAMFYATAIALYAFRALGPVE